MPMGLHFRREFPFWFPPRALQSAASIRPKQKLSRPNRNFSQWYNFHFHLPHSKVRGCFFWRARCCPEELVLFSLIRNFIHQLFAKSFSFLLQMQFFH